MAALRGGSASPVVVRKYGGSSLATERHLRHVARHIGALAGTGQHVVVVVSAQGDTTDDLISRADNVNSQPRGRELDQLLATGETASASLVAMALQRLGFPATALAGARSGILATGPHGSGIIVAIDTEHTRELLNAGQIVVVAGFQGVTAEGDTLTLGRGGSDTTAVAIAAELGARHCEIYTDVAGILSADPRVVPAARLLPTVEVNVMAEMAFAGARVMHARAVELAALYGVDIHVGNSVSARIGTRIHQRDGEDMLETRAAVVAVVHEPDVVRVTLSGSASQGDHAPEVFQILAQQAIPADMTTVTRTPNGGTCVGLTVHHSHTAAVRRSFTALAGLPHGGVDVDEHLAKVSIIGTGLMSRPEYAARMLSSLTREGIAARLLSASQLRVSVTVSTDQAGRAVRLLHTEFGLDAETGVEPLHVSSRP